jgi:predicted amidohydrolase YtcJ
MAIVLKRSAYQIDRFAKLGVIASMQPNHLLTDMNWSIKRLGAERAVSSYAWRSFLAAGVPLAFGTDYPVEPIYAIPRTLRRGHPQERSRDPKIFS